MSDFAAWLLSWLSAFLQWVLNQIGAVFVDFWTLVTDLLFFTFDKIFDLVVYIVGSMNWDFGVFNVSQYWNMMPAELVSVMNLLGVPIAMGMIVAALGIRFVLQLIPFVRWGS